VASGFKVMKAGMACVVVSAITRTAVYTKV